MSRPWTVLLLAILCGLGFWLRIDNLGYLGLVVDEGIQALAVKGILANDVPLVPSGAVYSRSYIFLYLQAATANLFGLEAFALRLPSVVFGVAVIPTGYYLAKSLFDQQIGFLTALILTVSAWEIELSRYARFYTMFQWTFIAALLCFYHGFMVRGGTGYRLAFLFFAFLSFATHPLAKLLLLSFVIPLVMAEKEPGERWRTAGWGGMTLLVLLLHNRIVRWLNRMGEYLDYPPDPTAAAATLFDQFRGIAGIPPLNPIDLSLFSLAFSQSTVLGLVLISLAVVAIRGLYLDNSEKPNAPAILTCIAAIVAAYFNQIGLALVVLTAYPILFMRQVSEFRHGRFLRTYFMVVLFLGIWLFIARSSAAPAGRDLLMALFGFPHFYDFLLHWLIAGWPLFLLVMLVGLAALLRDRIEDRTRPEPLFLLLSLHLLLFIPGFFKAFAESRYFFHLYPLLVMVFVFGLREILHWFRRRTSSEWLAQPQFATILLTISVLLLSQDITLIDTASAATRDYNTSRDPVRSVISWKTYAGFHQDHVTPANYVKANLQNDDIVVVAGPVFIPPIYQHYIGRVDVTVAPHYQPIYYGRLRDGKLVNYITGSDVLPEYQPLASVIAERTNDIWLLSDYTLLEPDNQFYSDSLKVLLKSLTPDTLILGRDQKSFAMWLKKP